jgi:retron-type reverse transcriptase
MDGALAVLPSHGHARRPIARRPRDRRQRRSFTRPKEATGNRERHKVHLVRYADDFIITGISKELLRDEVQPLVAHFLKERGLELSHEKTSITHIDDGFDFLGQHIRRYGCGVGHGGDIGTNRPRG